MPFFDVGTTYAGCRDVRLRYIDTSLPIARERGRIVNVVLEITPAGVIAVR